MNPSPRFRRTFQTLAAVAALGLLAGCASSDPGASGAPSGTFAQGPSGGGAPPGGGQPPSGGRPSGGPPGGPSGKPGQGPQTPSLASQTFSKYFTDLTPSTSDINAMVDALHTKGLFADWGTLFHPTQALTRAELAALLTLRYQGKAAVTADDRPDEPVTREEAAVWIFGAEQQNGMPPEMAGTDLSRVKDAAEIAEPARKAVATLLQLGVMKTEGGVFQPRATFTRAQIVPVLYRLWALGGGGPGAGPGGPGGPGGGAGKAPAGAVLGFDSLSPDQGGTAATVSTDATGVTYTSKGDAENALRIIGGGNPTLKNITVTKTAGAAGAGDSSNFSGANAAVLVTGGAQATFVNPRIASTASGANGLFVYGAGTRATVTGAVIRTLRDGSGGFMVAGGGTAVVTDGDVDTAGASSAALRSDRGGGTLRVEGGTYTAHGEGSPAVYSTAEVSVKNATLAATGSEAVVVEGKNSVVLENCQVTGRMVRADVESIHNVMLYQSMSGDAAAGRASFTMTRGALTSLAGEMFYVTNTSAAVTLTGVDLYQSSPVLLKVAGNDGRRGWGRVGANGGDLVFTAVRQSLAGTIRVDAVSKLALTLANGSEFTGTINEDGQAGAVAVTVDGTSTWALTADAHVTSFTGGFDRVVPNGHHLFVGGQSVN